MSNLKPNFGGFTFAELGAFKAQFMAMAANLFDELVSGEKVADEEMFLDSDPFHDRLPRRFVGLKAHIVVRQEIKQ